MENTLTLVQCISAVKMDLSVNILHEAQKLPVIVIATLQHCYYYVRWCRKFRFDMRKTLQFTK